MQRKHQAGLVSLVLATFVVLPLLFETSRAEPARFWLSTSDAHSQGPEAPAIAVPIGIEQILHIWGRPATESSGAYQTLSDISLNLVAQDASVIEFVPGTFEVYNEPAQRFEFVRDSHPDEALSDEPLMPQMGLDVFGCENCKGYGIFGLQGFSLSSDFLGIGPLCDEYCLLADDGLPAWQIATLALTTTLEEGVASLFLQVGDNGIRHQSQESHETQVIFGFDPSGSESVYHAGNPAERNWTSPADQPHATILARSTAAAPGDYDRNGVVDLADYNVWKMHYSSTTQLEADGNGNGVVDAADYTLWRDHHLPMLGTAHAHASATVPEPSSGSLLLLIASGITLSITNRIGESRDT